MLDWLGSNGAIGVNPVDPSHHNILHPAPGHPGLFGLTIAVPSFAPKQVTSVITNPGSIWAGSVIVSEPLIVQPLASVTIQV